MHGFRVVPYNIPQGRVAGYYPECNALIAIIDCLGKQRLDARLELIELGATGAMVHEFQAAFERTNISSASP
jgi:hypothetical protein